MKLFFLIILFLLFNGCTNKIFTPEQRLKILLNIDSNLKADYIKTEFFTLYSLQKISKPCKDINIYIEGDGLAWLTRSKISDNPTPINPVALKLMKQDDSSCKIYLARPCQYISSSLCKKRYWTSARFHSKIIQSYQIALNKIKKKYKNTTFKLIGFSGGGAVALLTAAKRNDINQIVTIAGNLNHDIWTQIHNNTPLTDSLNPIDYINNVKNIDQVHLIGTYDKIIPKEVALSYAEIFPYNHKIKLIDIDSNHTCCWNKVFSSIINPKK